MALSLVISMHFLGRFLCARNEIKARRLLVYNSGIKELVDVSSSLIMYANEGRQTYNLRWTTTKLNEFNKSISQTKLNFF